MRTPRGARKHLGVWAFLFGGALLIGSAGALFTRSAHATPAYARRFDTKCATCHSPMPPRLNNVGMLYKRYGFRLPDSDENGNLKIRMEAAHGIMDATAISASLDARQDPEAAPGTSRSTMGVDEITIVGGTSIDDHLSAQYIFPLQNGEGSPELEDVEVQAIGGKTPAQQFSLRAGKMQTLLWQKGTDGSITPSLPLVLDEVAPAPVGDFGGFGLGAKQVGLEAGFTMTKLNQGHVLSTLASASILNGFTDAGEAAPQNPTNGVDYLLQAYELIGSRNTVGAFYYNGRTVVDAPGALIPPGPFSERFDRVGVAGSYAPTDWFEITGAGVTGKDKSQQLARNVTMEGGYLEGTGSIRPNWTATYRWEQVDPDRDTGGDLIRADVIATTYLLWDHVLLTGEYRQQTENNTKPHSLLGIVRLVY